MPTDRYTKTVLTVIAACLVALTAQNATRSAAAQQQAGPSCTIMAPCFVTNTGITPLNIVDARTTPTPSERLRNLPPNSGQPR